ncbi:MAG: dihydroorotate dehydrogenase electron transfer subunit [Chloroflexi bacterium]|nr:dihydroorotate dehydrogenase electron transfer subunit [Chloroflexota bacterium]
MEPMKQLTGRVISCNEVAQGIYLIWVGASEIAATSRPGQFVTIRCGEDALLRRPFSIHRVRAGQVALLFAVVGPGTVWLSSRKEGDFLDILGPLGNGFEIPKKPHNLILVAGGVGIAPLAYLAEDASARGSSVRLILGAANGSRLISGIEGAEVSIVTEDGSYGKKGKATDFLPSQVEWANEIFACGPLPMYRTMAEMLPHFGDRPVQVTLEQVMGCGVGACRGCAVPTRHGPRMVCSDGPVFDLREIVWDDVKEPGARRFK